MTMRKRDMVCLLRARMMIPDKWGERLKMKEKVWG